MTDHITFASLKNIYIFEFYGRTELNHYNRRSTVIEGYGAGEEVANLEDAFYNFGDGEDLGFGDICGNGYSYNDALLLEKTNA